MAETFIPPIRTLVHKPRIASVDLLKGVVMLIMALDHIREYFHYAAFMFDPADPTQTTFPIFFTRWITHFCAPAFSFLAGISAYMVGKRKTPKELSAFLIKRGLWLILIELTLSGFGWTFDIHFKTFSLLVLWVWGVSMIVLAGLIHLPRHWILILSVLIICLHNLLDQVNFLYGLHNIAFINLPDGRNLFIGYPLIPWFAVMSLGYYFGGWYDKPVDKKQRRKLFNAIGIMAIIIFLVLRATNLYGDPNEFKHYGTLSQNIISFFNPTKYPPSLLFLLMTLGVTFLFLANSEKLKGRIVNFLSMFGRVPFFYYILHIYLIHVIALVFAQLSGLGWQKMVFSSFIDFASDMKGHGFSLLVVYIVWIGVILLLYPICKRFDRYKQNHKEKWWLSYL